MYTWKDIVYVANDVTGEEVTSYAIPITLDKIQIHIEMQNQHEQAVRTIQRDMTKWLSNTVIVVDTSGSMKNADVWDTRTRLDAVWLSVALDFIANRIESGAAGPMDVISVVSMGEKSVLLIHEQPTTWVLYNQIVELYSEKRIKPMSHGYYIPSLKKAQRLLTRNTNESCSVGLCFISDGKPSDYLKYCMTVSECDNLIIERVASLAPKFGRRMTLDAVGIGSADEFGTLQRMVDKAKDYGVKASMQLPSSSSSALGDVLHSFASSITSTQIEMTDLNTSKQQRVKNVIRESRSKASIMIQTVSQGDFWVYNKTRVKRLVYEDKKTDRGYKGELTPGPLQHQNAECVALARGPFGEGAERFAYRFYELLGDRQTIIGKPLVAKESRYIMEGCIDDERARTKFVNTFCRTQKLAGRIAREFNSKLDSLRRVDDETPRVEFLDCSVYKLDDRNIGNLRVLVEEKIDQIKWTKWNANNGYVRGMKEAPKFDETDLQIAMKNIRNIDLDILEEGEEEEDEISCDNGSISVYSTPIVFTAADIAQAFSHFSYWATGRKRLICDIQGVFCEETNNLRLSDPVIHYYNHLKENKKMVHGRTDRGRKGFAMFWATHKCNELCHLVTNGFKNAERCKVAR